MSFEIRFHSENTLKWGWVNSKCKWTSGVNKIQVFCGCVKENWALSSAKSFGINFGTENILEVG